MLPCISCPARCGRPQLPSLASDKPPQGQGPGLTTGLLAPRCVSSSRLQLLRGALAIHAALRQRSRWSAQRCVGHGGWSQGRGAQVCGAPRCVGWGALCVRAGEGGPDGETFLLYPVPSPPANTYSLETMRGSQHEPHPCCAAAAD